MNLFKSELFSSTMLHEIQPRAPRSYREPTFAPHYGRRRVATAPTSAPILFAAIEAIAFAGAIEQIGDKCVLLDYDEAA
jgi:hypothetical protein